MLGAVFEGPELVRTLQELEVSHVVMIPDSTLGRWEPALAAAEAPRLVRVCREGEAWAVAAGLHLGGARPFVMMQCTGLFESGDALRNVIHDWGLPLFALVGLRNYLGRAEGTRDTCLTFTRPILDAWRLDVRFMESPSERGLLAEHYRACRARGTAGVLLMAEGRG